MYPKLLDDANYHRLIYFYPTRDMSERRILHSFPYLPTSILANMVAQDHSRGVGPTQQGGHCRDVSVSTFINTCPRLVSQPLFC